MARLGRTLFPFDAVQGTKLSIIASPIGTSRCSKHDCVSASLFLQVVMQSTSGALELYTAGVVPLLLRHARLLLQHDLGALLGPDATQLLLQPPDGMSHFNAPASRVLPNCLAAYCWNQKQGKASFAQLWGASPHQDVVVWSNVHQQWCLWLNLAASLLRMLGGVDGVEEVAMDLLVAVEERLLLLLRALQPAQQQQGVGGTAAGAGGVGPQVPLSMALLVELERGLVLLEELAVYSGAWQLVRPGSLAQFKGALLGVLQLFAQPGRNSR